MTSRIDEQNHRSADKAIEEKRRDLKRQMVQRDFAKKLIWERGLHKKPVSPQKAKLPPPPKPQPKTKPDPQPQEARKPPINQRSKNNSQENKRPDKNPSLSEKAKGSDLIPNKPVRRKNDDRSEERFKESDAFLQVAVQFATQGQSQTKELAPAYAPCLPKEVVDQLVERIYTSTAADGLKEITIELRGGVLSGAKIKVTSRKGDVKLHFSSDNVRTKALLRNSKNAIADRLEEKNFSLLEFSVH